MKTIILAFYPGPHKRHTLSGPLVSRRFEAARPAHERSTPIRYRALLGAPGGLLAFVPSRSEARRVRRLLSPATGVHPVSGGGEPWMKP